MATNTAITSAADPNEQLFVSPILGHHLGVAFLGNFWLVLGGCGSTVLAAFPQVGIGLLGVSLAFGLASRSSR